MSDIEDKEEIVNLARTKLEEHFETVRIFVSYRLEDGTNNYAYYNTGSGSFESQMSQVDSWVKEKRAYQNGYYQEQGRQDFIDQNNDIE